MADDSRPACHDVAKVLRIIRAYTDGCIIACEKEDVDMFERDMRKFFEYVDLLKKVIIEGSK